GHARLERERTVTENLYLHGVHELHALLCGLHVARCELRLARDVDDPARECGIRMAVAHDARGLAERHTTDAVLAHVDADPAVVGVHQGDDRLTRADRLAGLTVAYGDDPCERGAHDRIAERRIDLCERCLRCAHLCSGGVDALAPRTGRD